MPNPPAACANPGFNACLTTAVPVVVGQTSYCSEEPEIIHYDPTGAQVASPAACTALGSFFNSVSNSVVRQGNLIYRFCSVCFFLLFLVTAPIEN